MKTNSQIPYPKGNTKVTLKKLKSGIYVYYETGRSYNNVTKHTTPIRKCIGKKIDENSDFIVPNSNYYELFPLANLDEKLEQENLRSSALAIGAYIAIKKIIQNLELDACMSSAISNDVERGLFFDFLAYEIICKTNVAQHFHAYAYKHPLFTPNMDIYSDSSLSKLFRKITCDQRQVFLNCWNSKTDKNSRIYISYDSTNRHTKAGNIEEAEYGKAKDGLKEPIINQGVAYDCDNRIPLFYDSYPGSIVDISMLEYMVREAQSYGYKNIGFILDRGYFSKDNLRFMENSGYEFVIMAKGNAKFIHSLVEEAMGTFELERNFLIQKFRVNGTTIIRQLFQDKPLKKEQYIHVYYSERTAIIEKKKLESNILKWERELKKRIGKHFNQEDLLSYNRYFKLSFEDGKLISINTNNEVIEEEKFWMGYFCIVTSEEMTAKQAIYLYKGRDSSEKIFLSDKSFLGNETYRVNTQESKDSKEWISFVSEIVRNKIYINLIDAQEKLDNKTNLLTVPAALAELDKYEICERVQGGYCVHHPLTRTQKQIFNALNISIGEVKEETEKICETLNINN